MVEESEEVVLALIEVTSNHLDLSCRGQTRADVVLAGDSRNWLNVRVVCIHRGTYSYISLDMSTAKLLQDVKILEYQKDKELDMVQMTQNGTKTKDMDYMY